VGWLVELRGRCGDGEGSCRRGYKVRRAISVEMCQRRSGRHLAEGLFLGALSYSSAIKLVVFTLN